MTQLKKIEPPLIQTVKQKCIFNYGSILAVETKEGRKKL